MENFFNLQSPPPPQYTSPAPAPPTTNVGGDTNGGSLDLLAEVSTSLASNLRPGFEPLMRFEMPLLQTFLNSLPPPSYTAPPAFQTGKSLGDNNNKAGGAKAMKSQVDVNFNTLLPPIRHLIPKRNSGKRSGLQKVMKAQKQIPKLSVPPTKQRNLGPNSIRAQTQPQRISIAPNAPTGSRPFPGCFCPTCVRPPQINHGVNYPYRPSAPVPNMQIQWNRNSFVPVPRIPAHVQPPVFFPPDADIHVPPPRPPLFFNGPQFAYPPPPSPLNLSRFAGNDPEGVGQSMGNMRARLEQQNQLSGSQNKSSQQTPRMPPQSTYTYKVPVTYPFSVGNCQPVVFSNGRWSFGKFICEICSFVTSNKNQISNHRYEHPDRIMTYIEIDPFNPTKIVDRFKCDYIPSTAAQLSKRKVL